MFYRHFKGHIEALLFASGDPLSIEKLSEILDIEVEHITLLLAELQEDMKHEDRGVFLAEVAGGYQFCTKPVYASVLEKLVLLQEPKLSQAALETLAIIAFKQPTTRQEIEIIRGVKVDRVIHTLVERQLIKEVGRKEVLGRPILYGTTEVFLQCLGISSLKDLPPLAQLLPSDFEGDLEMGKMEEQLEGEL